MITMERKRKRKKASEKQPVKHLNRIQKRVHPREAGQVNDGAECARIIQREFNKLSEFKLNSIGTEATTGYVEGLIPSSPDLDFEVLLGSRRIAQIDTTGSNYTFLGCGCMPVRDYKGYKVKKLEDPTFFVYWMKREFGEVKDCCYWIRGEDVIKKPLEKKFWGNKVQYNHMTDKADWHRGLDSLIEELRKLTKH